MDKENLLKKRDQSGDINFNLGTCIVPDNNLQNKDVEKIY